MCSLTSQGQDSKILMTPFSTCVQGWEWGTEEELQVSLRNTAVTNMISVEISQFITVRYNCVDIIVKVRVYWVNDPRSSVRLGIICKLFINNLLIYLYNRLNVLWNFFYSTPYKNTILFINTIQGRKKKNYKYRSWKMNIDHKLYCIHNYLQRHLFFLLLYK